MRELMNFLEERRILLPLFIILIAANIFIWKAAVAEKNAGEFALYFLNIGQGDSQLVNLPGDVQVLIDGGKGAQILNELGKILAPTDRYIDLVVATHPDLDHYGGLIDVLKNYEVGAILTNGRGGAAGAFKEFQNVIVERKVSEVHLLAGDAIRYGETKFAVLNPTPKDLAERMPVNASGIVLLLEHAGLPSCDDSSALCVRGLRVLYTADVDTKKEAELAQKYDLAADILKVGHHGSKYSSGNTFLNEVQPKLAFIEVGKNNYGHPTAEALTRLANIGAQVFTTQEQGTMKVFIENQKLKVSKL